MDADMENALLSCDGNAKVLVKQRLATGNFVDELCFISIKLFCGDIT